MKIRICIALLKIRICIALLIISLMFSISGCQDEVKPSVEMVANQEPQTIVIKSTETDPRTNELATKLSEFSFDFDSDKEEEKIELYTAAGRDENGEMMYDDGQKWLLVVVDENKYYSLVSGFVQLGQVYFSLGTIGEERIPQVNVIIATHCGMEITEYIFNNEKEQFEGEEICKPKDINEVFTSIPGY